MDTKIFPCKKILHLKIMVGALTWIKWLRNEELKKNICGMNH
jgi:hypothetical protein